MQLVKAKATKGTVSIEAEVINKLGLSEKKYIDAKNVKMLCAGIRETQGFVLISEDDAVYIASFLPNLKEIVDDLKSICDVMEKIGNQQFITSVTGGGGAPAVGVLGNPLLSVAESSKAIKEKLEAVKFV